MLASSLKVIALVVYADWCIWKFASMHKRSELKVRQINHRWLITNKRNMPVQKRTSKRFLRPLCLHSDLVVLPRLFGDLGTSVGQPLLQVCKSDFASLCHYHSVHAAT